MSEDFFEAVSTTFKEVKFPAFVLVWNPCINGHMLFVFKVPASHVEVLVDTGAYTGFKKVQIQIRLREKDFTSKNLALLTGEDIIDEVNGRNFLFDFVAALNSSSYRQDHVDHAKFGWMIPGYDVVLLSASGFPVVGKDRNPDYRADDTNGSTQTGTSSSEEQLKLLLLGVVLGGAIIIGLLVMLYCRLRSQYASLEKDKGVPSSLRQMWQRYNRSRHYLYPLIH